MASSASQQVDSRGDRERPISGYPVVPIFILLSQLTNSPNKRINMYYENRNIYRTKMGSINDAGACKRWGDRPMSAARAYLPQGRPSHPYGFA